MTDPTAALRTAPAQSLREAFYRYEGAGDGGGSVQTPAVRDLVQAVYQFIRAGCCGPDYIAGYEQALATSQADDPSGPDARPFRDAWGAFLEDIIGLWATGEPDQDDVLETLSEHRPIIEAAIRADR